MIAITSALPQNLGEAEVTTIFTGMSVGGLILFALNVLFLLNSLLAFLYLLFAGLQYTTAAGDMDKVRSAQNSIRGAVIGLVVSILAFTIVQFIGDFLNIDIPLF